MRILLVGATGTIGRAVSPLLFAADTNSSKRATTGRRTRSTCSIRSQFAHSTSGSFTLTSGVLAHEPVPGSAAVSLVNAAVEAFGRAAAVELPRRLRINVVSPPWVTETLLAAGRDPSAGLLAAELARSYVATVEGRQTGEIIAPAPSSASPAGPPRQPRSG